MKRKRLFHGLYNQEKCSRQKNLSIYVCYSIKNSYLCVTNYQNKPNYNMINSKFLLSAMFAMACSATVFAQDDSFDLSSQRGEKQDVNMVPGKKINHHGIIVNPTPHNFSVDAQQLIDLSQGVNVVDKQKKFANDLGFVKQNKKGVKLTIDFGEKAAQKAGLKKMVSGAYLLTADNNGINIVGYDERGAFYALQTMRQLLDSPATGGKMPYTQCNDYPDLPLRGVVEGFYGEPWSHQVRLSLIEYYGRNKLNEYVYGPKDDPYHSSPNWRKPYPEDQARNIHELVEACNRNRVDFVWAIHPGKDIKWNEEDYQNLVNKFNHMYDLGVRSFAIHFDDIEGEGTDSNKQVDLLNRLTKEFVKTKSGVAPLVVCPTDYSQLWASPKENGQLAIYGKRLDPSINVFWTGAVVCSDLDKATLDFVDSRIKRPAYYWWNFPVTDYARHIIMQGPAYGLENDITDQMTCGVLSNPMEHGEASKLALYGVADYNWNVKDYNPIDNWERGLVDLTPEAHDAYRTFAIHSCDTETGYRRAESWETRTFRLSDYTDAKASALKNEFEKVEKAPDTMERDCKNPLLMKELRPWLVEFKKLGKRCNTTLDLMKEFRSGNYASFWSNYLRNRMTNADLTAYQAHKSGTMKLQPFYENGMDDMAVEFFHKIAGKTPAFYNAVGTYATLRTTQSKLMLDGDIKTFYHSGNSQNTGDWIGLDLGAVRPVREVRIIQGRNSVDDVDYFDNTILEASADGKTWTALTGELPKTYEINWKGEPIEARYVRMRKLQSEKKSWCAVREFIVNPTTPESLPFKVEAADVNAAMPAFDENPCTSFNNAGKLTFGIENGTVSYTLLTDKAMAKGNVVFNQYNKKGKLISSTPVDNSLMSVNVVKKAVKAELEGSVEVFEIIANK